MYWTHTHMWCLAYLNFLWRTEVSYLEKQRDKMVSVCDWVNTQCLGMRINWVIYMQVFCFLFSLPRCFPRHGPLSWGEPTPGWPNLHKEKRTLPQAPAGFSRLVALPHWMPHSAHLCHSRFGDQNPTPFRSGRSPISQDRLTHVQPLFTCKGFKRCDTQKKEATRISGRPCSLGEQHKISNSYTARIARCVPHTRI